MRFFLLWLLGARVLLQLLPILLYNIINLGPTSNGVLNVKFTTDGNGDQVVVNAAGNLAYPFAVSPNLLNGMSQAELTTLTAPYTENPSNNAINQYTYIQLMFINSNGAVVGMQHFGENGISDQATTFYAQMPTNGGVFLSSVNSSIPTYGSFSGWVQQILGLNNLNQVLGSDGGRLYTYNITSKLLTYIDTLSTDGTPLSWYPGMPLHWTLSSGSYFDPAKLDSQGRILADAYLQDGSGKILSEDVLLLSPQGVQTSPIPIPEPSSLIVFAILATGFGVYRVRSRRSAPRGIETGRTGKVDPPLNFSGRWRDSGNGWPRFSMADPHEFCCRAGESGWPLAFGRQAKGVRPGQNSGTGSAVRTGGNGWPLGLSHCPGRLARIPSGIMLQREGGLAPFDRCREAAWQKFSRILLRGGNGWPLLDRCEAAWQNSHEFCYEGESGRPLLDRCEAAWQNSHEFCYEPGKWLAPSRIARGGLAEFSRILLRGGKWLAPSQIAARRPSRILTNSASEPGNWLAPSRSLRGGLAEFSRILLRAGKVAGPFSIAARRPGRISRKLCYVRESGREVRMCFPGPPEVGGFARPDHGQLLWSREMAGKAAGGCVFSTVVASMGSHGRQSVAKSARAPGHFWRRKP